MTPEQASLIEQAERLLTGASPHPWAVPIDFGTPWNIDDANGAAVALTAQRRSTAPDTIRNGNTAFIAAAPTLVAALAAELKRALDENAKLRERLAKCEPVIEHIRGIQSDLENDHKDRAWDSFAELRAWKLPPKDVTP